MKIILYNYIQYAQEIQWLFIALIMLSGVALTAQTTNTDSSGLKRSDYTLTLNKINNTIPVADSLSSPNAFANQLSHPPLKADSNLNFKKQPASLPTQKDTTKSSHHLLKPGHASPIHLKGNLSAQFDYGTIPYYLQGTHSPAMLFKTEGHVKIGLKKLPLVLNYFYMNPANSIGLQNYFTLRFDTETFTENTDAELNTKKAETLRKLKDAEKLKQQYEQKLTYNETLLSRKYDLKNSAFNRPGLASGADSLLPQTTISTQSFQNLKPETDSLSIDSNSAKVKAYREKINRLESQIKDYNNALALINANEKGIINPNLNKRSNVLKNIKTFEIGLCYPNYSSFLINNITLKGLNTEYSTSRSFFNLSIGSTVRNLLTPLPGSNSIQALFQKYDANFFDFNNTSDAQKVIAAKYGFGNVNKSYVAFGALYGKGRQSYLSTSRETETNAVYELDGKTTFKWLVFSAAFAKSFLNQQLSSAGEGSQNNALNRNNGIQLRLQATLPYVKTKLLLGFKLVDPFFKSYGVGFIRTDNIRYEARLDQAIGSRVKVGMSYRLDEDNIYRSTNYKSKLQVVTFSSRFKLFKRKIDINLIYTPIVNKIVDFSKQITIQTRSDMKNVVITYTPRLKKVTSTFTGLFSRYNIQDVTSTRHLDNFNLNAITIFKNSVRLSVSESYFNSSVSDSATSPNILLSVLELGYAWKTGLTASAAIKHSYQVQNHKNQYGGSCRLTIPIKKRISLELHAEKLLMGDFYNSLNFDNLNRFPYYAYVKLNYKF